MTGIALMFVAGVGLSAFFSGSETGFYRVTRVRLALDGMSGDPISRVLLWLTNNPTLFVATTLIGNNIANYMTSMAIVLGTQRLLGSGQLWAEVAAPVALSPVLFVYGELLPKNIFLLAPNRLLRAATPLFLAFGVCFLPVSAILWLLGRGLQRYVGGSMILVRSGVARKELQSLLHEGQAVGVLRPTQRQMTQAIFDFGNRPVRQFHLPLNAIVAVRDSASYVELDRVLRRHPVSELLVLSHTSHKALGYVRAIDAHLLAEQWPEAVRPLMKIGDQERYVSALTRMQAAAEAMAELVDPQGRTLGILLEDRLLEPLFRQR